METNLVFEIIALVRSQRGGDKGTEAVSLRRVNRAGETLTRAVDGLQDGWSVF